MQHSSSWYLMATITVTWQALHFNMIICASAPDCMNLPSPDKSFDISGWLVVLNMMFINEDEFTHWIWIVSFIVGARKCEILLTVIKHILCCAKDSFATTALWQQLFTTAPVHHTQTSRGRFRKSCKWSCCPEGRYPQRLWDPWTELLNCQ